MKSSQRSFIFRLTLPLMVVFTALLIQSARADFFGDHKITFQQNDTFLDYGQYGEVEFFLSNIQHQNVAWEIDEEELPMGMELQQTTYNNVLLFGTPTFIDKWCFTLKAKISDGANETKGVAERVCVQSQKSEQSNLPIFMVDRNIKQGTEDKIFSEKIQVSGNGQYFNFDGKFFYGDLPEGVDLEVNNQQLEFLLRGTPGNEGVFAFVLGFSVIDQNNQEFSVYKQFQWEVTEQNFPGYMCPTGYYYDNYLKHCVQNGGGSNFCGSGTFYSPFY